MSNFIEVGFDNKITLNVRVDQFNYFELPRDDFNYQWAKTDAPLFHIYIECIGIQHCTEDTFKVDVSFLKGLTQVELADLRKIYTVGTLIRISGSFFVTHSDDDWRVTVTDPTASFLPATEIRELEEHFGESFSQQQTLESGH